ncbi:hypothetical protein EGW08_009203, partial [Elysia chlorotica]
FLPVEINMETGRRRRPVMNLSRRLLSSLVKFFTALQKNLTLWSYSSMCWYSLFFMRASTEISGSPHTLVSNSCHVNISKAASGTTFSKPVLMAFICCNMIMIETRFDSAWYKKGQGFPSLSHLRVTGVPSLSNMLHILPVMANVSGSMFVRLSI